MTTEPNYRPLGFAASIQISEPIFVEGGVKYNPITRECSTSNGNISGAVRAYMKSSTTTTTNNDSDWTSDN